MFVDWIRNCRSRTALGIFFLLVTTSVMGDEPYRLTETLPIMSVGPGKRVISLPYRNNGKSKVVFQTHAASCVCTRVVQFPKLDVSPGEEIEIPIEFELRPGSSDRVELGLLIEGVRLDPDTNEPAPRSRLAEYKVTIPISDVPLRLLREFEVFQVAHGKCSNIDIVNASSFRWAEVRVKASDVLTDGRDRPEGTIADQIKASVQLGMAQLASRDVQVASVSLVGLESLIGAKKAADQTEIELCVSAKPENSLTFIDVGKLKVKLRVVGSLEIFPRAIDLATDIDKLKVNVVGRAQVLTAMKDQFQIIIGDKTLVRNVDYTVSELSPRWLRFEIEAKLLLSSPGEAVSHIEFLCDRFAWREQVKASGQ